MNISIADLFEMGYSITDDIDGVDAEHETQIFNIGYNLFIIKFDKLYPGKRFTEKVVKSTKYGVLTNVWGDDGSGGTFNDFFQPHDVMEITDPVDLTGTVTFTTDSTAVSAVNGAFESQLEAGDIIFLDGEEQYGAVVQSITDDNNLILDAEYEGTGGAGTGKVLGVEVKDLPEKTSRFVLDESDSEDEKGFYKDLDRIYFPGYNAGTYFRLRYLPEIAPITSATLRTTEKFMPFKYRHFFARYIAAMYAVVEEEQNLTAHAELEFDKNFAGMGKQYNNTKPIIVTPRTVKNNPKYDYPTS